ncbi:N-6 DNA methylase [Streptomyces abyssomicinicus]|uniref:N-6 DNA methylase n=1 Tax=Streptomyces abyssomicinicus TaxID=574929 RepID=UPI0012505FE8|nr:N-6 DNA methylase [Streptomyces abyssomicinicus]
MQENATEVTAAGIARLAGVGRAAVSNWRRRHADFPKPVGGTETSPAFLLGEVEEWLRRQGKLAEVPLRERVWQQVAGHPDGPAAALTQVGCVLLLVHERPTRWLEAAAGSDERLAALLPADLAQILAVRLGTAATTAGSHHALSDDGAAGGAPGPAPLAPPAVRPPTGPQLLPSVPLLRGAAELAAENGARHTYEFLLDRYVDPRHHTLTPPGLADLMADLAGTGGPDRPGSPRVVLDPACGTGTLLRAAARTHPARELHGQDSAPALAELTALRLALHAPGPVRTAAADTLRGDAFPALRADAVLCHPPFNERNWGHDELAYDPRWEYGFPARTESELAWVQHSLARLREGGTAVLLMPPAAASRRSGRRIRADLLRRGALRAVIALPPGTAPPHSLPLHLWVLRRPGRSPVRPEVLLVDTLGAPAVAPGATGPASRSGPDCDVVREIALDVWQAYERTGAFAERPGVARVVPVIDLLDDDVDLTPARHLPPPVTTEGPEQLVAVRERLDATLRLTAELAPAPPPPGPAAREDSATGGSGPVTTVGELVRGGALTLALGGTGGRRGLPVLTDLDVINGTAPSPPSPPAPATSSRAAGTGGADDDDAAAADDDTVVTRAGDVVLPVSGGEPVARVVDEVSAGAALGRNLVLLRPDPETLDPWFLAGFLRGTANHRRASSFASTATRLDVRRLRVPRLPLEEQRRHGERFRALDEFEGALRQVAQLGERLIRGSYDALTEAAAPPP